MNARHVHRRSPVATAIAVTITMGLTYANDGHDISLSAGATNLTNKGYWRNFFIYQELGYPNVEAQPAPPREGFVTLRKKF